MKRLGRAYSDTRGILANKVSPDQLLQPVTRVLSNLVSPEQLEAGDHIYSWRRAYSYAHHGYLSLSLSYTLTHTHTNKRQLHSGKVIHFTRPEGQQLTGTILDKVASIDGSVPCHAYGPCKECGDKLSNKGVVCTCLKCFLADGYLYRYDYGKSAIKFLLNVRGGTCTLALSDPPVDVLHRANYLLRNGFRCYNLFQSNCEDFAVYCKTGLFVVKGTAVGASGQATTVVGAPLAMVVASPVYLAGPMGMALMVVGMYSLSRYFSDVKNRPGASKIAVEDLVKKLSLVAPLSN
ncbi:hypothetical protein L7F22_030000 [Adiantum nelumboides]|nr:hypothetical protein [Adiantum nelumboides]